MLLRWMSFRSKQEIAKINKELEEKKKEIDIEIYNNNWILENGYDVGGFCTAAICHIRLTETVEEEEKEIIKCPFQWSIDIIVNRGDYTKIYAIRNGVILAVFHLCKRTKIDIAVEIIKESLSLISELTFATINHISDYRSRHAVLPFFIRNNELVIKNSTEEARYYKNSSYYVPYAAKEEDILSFEIKNGKWIVYLKNNTRSSLHFLYERIDASLRKLLKKSEFMGILEVVFLQYDENLPHFTTFPLMAKIPYEEMEKIRDVLGGSTHY